MLIFKQNHNKGDLINRSIIILKRIATLLLVILMLLKNDVSMLLACNVQNECNLIDVF